METGKPRKPRKRKEKPVIAAAAAVIETVIQRVPEPMILTVDYDALRKDAAAWAMECGLGQVQVDGPDREDFPQCGFGYIFQITEISGKQLRATARYNCHGLRNFWSMDSLVTG